MLVVSIEFPEGRAMCYQKPVQLLENLLEAVPLEPNERGHTAMDDFEHFCAYAGCTEVLIGPQAFACVKLAYIDVKTTASCQHPGRRPPPQVDPLRSDNFFQTGQSANSGFANWGANKRPLTTAPNRPRAAGRGRHPI
ncbi:hypothetical protein [Paraburkholderia podalyriae]|nr:hypothetical protein [Paraburkholderia podalyriae]